MRGIALALTLGALFGYSARGQVADLHPAACPVDVPINEQAIAGDRVQTFDSLFKVTALVRSLTSPVVYATTAAPHALPDRRKQNPDDGPASFMTAVMAAINASASSIYSGEELSPEDLDDLHIQILRREKTTERPLEPQRLTVALCLALMMATYSWKIGSYSGMKCCVFLLFLVYFRLRSLHDTTGE